MAGRRRSLLCGLSLLACLAAFCPPALGLPPAAGTQAGRPLQVAAHAASNGLGGGPCKLEVPVIGGLTGQLCEAAGGAAGAVGALAGEAAGAVGKGILGLLASWMIGAATQITTFLAREMQQSTTPQLQSAWFQAQFAPMADLGAALGLLVALIALASAAIRRSPQALAATLAGIARAGLGTGLIVALTAIGLGIADQISSAVAASSPHAFWSTVAHAWGTSGFGGFGSSALAMLIALIEVFAAIFVWLELIVRNAAIYVAVLFFPTALAAGIWPALAAWPGRLGRLLALFVILKPVALIVLSFAGSAAAAGLSFSSGVPGSVGTILAATVIFALAAFAPWALMHILAADAESAHVASGVRGAAVAAVADEQGRSVRNAGGLRQLAGNWRAGGSDAGSAGGGSSTGGGGSPGGGGAGGPSADGGGAGAGSGSGLADGTLPVGAETIGAGSIGAAAGMSARPAAAGAPPSETRSPSSNDQAGSGHEGAEGGRPSGFAAAIPATGAASNASTGQRGDGPAVPPPTGVGDPTGASLERHGSAGVSAPEADELSAGPASGGPSPSAADINPPPARPPGARAPSGSLGLAEGPSGPSAEQELGEGEEE